MTDIENQNQNPDPKVSKKEEADVILSSNISSNSSDPNDWCPGEGPHPSD